VHEQVELLLVVVKGNATLVVAHLERTNENHLGSSREVIAVLGDVLQALIQHQIEFLIQTSFPSKNCFLFFFCKLLYLGKVREDFNMTFLRLEEFALARQPSFSLCEVPMSVRIIALRTKIT